MVPDLAIGKTNVSEILRSEYKKLGESWITLIKTPVEKSFEVSAEAVDSLSSQVGKEIKKLLALICECRKSCKNTTQLVGDLNDAIK